jgi:hypothetical protein
MKRLPNLLSGALLLSCLWLCASGALAAPKAPATEPDAVVTGVQMPAWLDRDGKSQPLMPGDQLRNGDSIRTGANSRVLVRTGDGSAVRLGENAKLKLSNLGKHEDNLFTATLDVAAGAFRFTTDVLMRLRRREVDVKIATVTAGIRGTDVWGKATSEKDLVCLLEGHIAVTHGDDAPVDMTDANTFYVVPKGAAPLPIAPVDKEKLAQWSLETEITSGAGAARAGGKWKVVLAVADSQGAALDIYDAVRAGGYPAEIYPVGTSEKRRYQVRISQLPSKSEAQQLANSLKGQFGVTSPSVAG